MGEVDCRAFCAVILCSLYQPGAESSSENKNLTVVKAA